MSRSKANAFTRATLHHGIDEILAEKKPIAMEDVLKPLEGQKKVNCVLVEGPPGVGKSTFAWELCQRWGSIPDLKKFSLVVLLRFRDKRVQDAKDIADLFYHPDASIQQAVAKEVCSRNGEGLLLILDGFDEFPASLRKRSLLLDIIKGSQLPGCTVVITSRPSATADLTSCRVDKRIEVLGFTQKEIEEYASKFFDSEPQLLDGFHQYRNLNPAIKSMMYIPLNTTIVAEVFLTSGGKPLSHTMTELYVEMAFSILIRFLKEIGQDALVGQILQLTKLQDLPSDVLSHFLKLGEMAFKGTIKEEVIFNEFPNDCEHFGFLNASPELYARKPALSYNFLHKSIQELFAAFHISQLPPSEQKEIFHKYNGKTFNPFGNYDRRFKEVWMFVAGLTGFMSIDWDEVKSKCSPHQLVSYLYEAQDIAACDSVLGEIEDVFRPHSLFDCYAAGWCIAASECRLKLGFLAMGSGAGQFEAFSSGVKSRREVRGSVAELDLSNTPIKEEDVVHLMELPSSIWHKTSKLSGFQCELDASAMGRMAEFVLIRMVSLKHLDIRYNNLCEGDLVNVLDTLSKHECLETLLFGRHRIGCADVEALARLIRPDGGRLKELKICDLYTLSSDCLKMLMETLLQPSSLESLEMVDVDMSSALDSLALLADNTNLTSMNIGYIRPALSSILEVLKDNKSVKTLELLCLDNDDEICAVTSVLTANKYLDTLSINSVITMREDSDEDKRRRKALCLTVINALQHNKSLKKLLFPAFPSVGDLLTQTEKDAMDPRVVLTP